jgi:GAF domain-containing protein
VLATSSSSTLSPSEIGRLFGALESSEDLQTGFARLRWHELGIHASIGAPIIVDGRVWGVIKASRTTPNDPFPSRAERRLGDFAALVA